MLSRIANLARRKADQVRNTLVICLNSSVQAVPATPILTATNQPVKFNHFVRRNGVLFAVADNTVFRVVEGSQPTAIPTDLNPTLFTLLSAVR